VELKWSDQAALTVVMAARGYPGGYAKGGAIAGLDSISTAKVRAPVNIRTGHLQIVRLPCGMQVVTAVP
jgi:phosphoribosylamine-glycine ligase